MAFRRGHSGITQTVSLRPDPERERTSGRRRRFLHLQAAVHRSFHTRHRLHTRCLALGWNERFCIVSGLCVNSPATGTGLARGSSLLFLCPQEAWRAALLPGPQGWSSRGVGSFRGGTGTPPASPYSIRNVITFEVDNLPEVYTFFPSPGIKTGLP